MKRELSLTEGPLLTSLLRFTFPFLLANLLQAMYGAIDLMVVGRFGEVSGVSAVATGSQIMNMLTNVIVGLTMGGTIIIGQCIGAKRPEDAQRATGSLILIAAILALFLMPVVMLCAPMLARLMNAPAEAYDQTVRYVVTCSAGVFFIVGFNAVSGILRGLGDSKLPLLFVAISCVANIIGDLLLVAVFEMDVVGAALATVFSQGLSFIIALVVVRRRGLPYEFHRKHLRMHRPSALRILKVGSPIALQDSLVSLSFLMITSIINGLGLTVSAAVGVADRITGFMFLAPGAFSSAVAAMVAQNIGAGQRDRAVNCLKIGVFSSLTVGILFFLLAQGLGRQLIGLFNTDEAVMHAGAQYLKSFSIDCVIVAVVFCFTGFFSGCGKTFFTMIQSLISTFLVRIPAAYLISRMPAVTTFEIGFAAPLASVVSAILCVAYFRWGKWKGDAALT